MNTKDAIYKGLRGEVEIVCKNTKTGEEVREVSNNLVVQGAYSELAKLLGNLSDSNIYKMIFGTGGAVAPTASDATVTAIANAPLIVTSEFIDAYTLKFTGVWADTEVNVQSINELGLFFENNVMAARYVFGAMQKSVDWTWTINWTFSYVI